MGRALSFSLVGHAAVILAFLLLSATRQPARIAEVVRPIRFVASLDPPAATSRPRAARGVDAPATRPAPTTPAAPRGDAAAPQPRATSAEPAAAVAVSKIVIPATRPAATTTLPREAPAPPAGPSLGERLSRRLAAAAPAEPRAPEPSGPQIAALAPQEPPPAARPGPTGPAPAAVPPGGIVVPIGQFPHAWYLTLLRERVYARWTPPSQFYLGGRSPSALVAFRIDRGGGIDRIALREGSGFARFDQSALAAVQGLGAAPALPEQYPEETLDVIIRFQNE